MFRTVPFNIKENRERGRELLERALEMVAEQPIHPLSKVNGALLDFRVDVIDTETAYEVFAELPGFYKEQISVSYDDDGYLKIKAEREENSESVRYINHERRTGTLERVFSVPDIDKQNVNVSYENGILHIVLPKLANEENKIFFNID